VKKPRFGKCVHCLKDDVRVTDDHVFPKSWYPENTVASIEKWTVPACFQCNHEYGEIEQDLLIRLGLCIDPLSSSTISIVAKVLRSINPKYAKNETDARHRAAKRAKLLGEILKGNDFPSDSIYPNLGEKWGHPREQQHVVTFSNKSVRRIGEKIVRGIFYIEDRRFIEPTYIIEVQAAHDEHASDVAAIIYQYGQVYTREPGIVVYRAVSADDTISSLFKIEIWQQFKMYASVYNQANLSQPTS